MFCLWCTLTWLKFENNIVKNNKFTNCRIDNTFFINYAGKGKRVIN